MAAHSTRRGLLGLAAAATVAPLASCSRGNAPEALPSGMPSTAPVEDTVALHSGENRAEVTRGKVANPSGSGAGVAALASVVLPHLPREQNLLFSPASLALPLAMLANGAGGQTQRELLALFGAASLDSLNSAMNTLSQALQARSGTVEAEHRSGRVDLSLANSLWGQLGLVMRPSFLESTSRWYGAGVHGIDFAQTAQAAEAISSWAAEHTNQRIKNLVTPDMLSADTRLIVANTVWFRAPWAGELHLGRQLSFRRPGSSVTVDALATPTSEWAQGSGWRATALPYLGNGLAMALILPDQGRDQQLLEHWRDGGLAALLTGWQPAEVDLTLPRWRFENMLSLPGALQQAGLPHLFAGQQVDLGGVSASGPALTVSEVVQKTWIGVDEYGTEAAAATATVVEATAGRVAAGPRRVLALDRPFWFVIFDRQTACPLFIGRVVNPTS